MIKFAFKSKFRRCQRGVESITAIFMLLIMFAVITVLIAAFFQYNLSAQEQMNIEGERSQERIVLSKQLAGSSVNSIIIHNIGQIEVRIRAIYIDDDDQFTFFDPSENMNTNIEPSKSLTIPLDNPPFKEARIVAATERGVRTIDEIQQTEPTVLPPPPDTGKFYIGPLMLRFQDFKFQSFKTFNPNGQWIDGWLVPKVAGENCAWKITVTNNGSKSITLNGYSSLTTHPSGSSDLRSWFLWTTSQPNSIELPVNVPTSIILATASPDTLSWTGIYSAGNTCMVFLTFFGVYENGTAYAQTIPFEAAITIV